MKIRQARGGSFRACRGFFKYNFIYLFILGFAESVLFSGFSLVVASRGCSPVAVHGLLTAVASLVAEHGV